MRSKVLRKISGNSKRRAHRTIAGAIEVLELRRLLTVTLAGWDATALSGTTASPFVAQTADIGVATKPGLIRDTGLTAGSLTKGYSSSVFTANGSAVNGGASTTDLYFDLTVATNFTLSLSEFDLNYRSSGTGPKNAELDYSLNGGTSYTAINTAIGGAGFTTDSAGHSISPVDLSGITDLQNLVAGTAVRLRIVPYGGTAATGTFAVFDTTTGNDLAIQGTSVGGPGTPTIGSLSVSRTPISVGDQTTLSANNVAEVAGVGSITGVEFYTESNGTAGLQIGSDTDAGPGTASGTSYTLATTGSAVGTYTYYAVATDSNLNTSVPASTTLTVSSKPSFNFSTATFLANETDGTATITVNLSAPATADTTVDYTTSDGAHFGDTGNPNIDGAALAGRDYTTAAGTLHFAIGDTSKTFTVPLINVKTFEGTRSVQLTLSNPNSEGILGATTSSTLAITDNAVTAPNGVDLPTSTPSSSYELTLTTAAAINSFMALSPSSTNGFGSGTNVGPDMPFLEFSTGSTLFPTTYAASTVDSIKLSLFNTATTGTFGGHPGSFDVYLLSNDPDAPLAAPAYRYTSDGATGVTAIGTQGSPLLVGSATFTNNVAGFNDFIFDNLSADVRTALKASLNGKTPIRFVITPSTGSGASADWEGNSTFNSGAQKPQLTLITEKSAAVIENFTLDASSITVNKNGTATIKVDRSGSDLSDTATIAYATVDGSALAGTDYTTTSGILNFTANDLQESFTIPIADTAISPDKMFTVSISSPTVGGAGHIPSLVAPTTETIIIHDVRTTNIAQQAGDLATVQPAGPRAAPNGKNFFNIEGSGASASASFGVADFNTAGLNFTLPTGETIGTINSISLGTINAPASFTHAGAVDVYLVEDTDTDISGNNVALHFDTTDPTEGLNGQLGAKHLLGSFTFDSAQVTTTFTDVTLTTLDPAGVNLLKTALNSGAKFRIVMTPEDATVAATYAGTSFGTVDGVSNAYQAPRLSINYTKGTLDNGPPTVTDSSFLFASHPPKFTLTFSEDVSASLATSPITVTNLTAGGTVSYTASYDAGANIETLTFAGELPDGNYSVSVPTTVTDASGNALAATFTSDFFVLKGDVDRDRSVGFTDLVAIAQHYGLPGQTYSTGDLDGDGSVGFADLVAVAQNYGKTLAPPVTAPSGAVSTLAQTAPVFESAIVAPSKTASTPATKPITTVATVVKTPKVSPKPVVVVKTLKPSTKPVVPPVVSPFSTTRVSIVPRKKNDLFN
jgi:methionine-rich copper-binding protein CopC